MEFHGIKIDFIGLAAVVAAITALYSKMKANSKKKEVNDAPEKSSTGTHDRDS